MMNMALARIGSHRRSHRRVTDGRGHDEAGAVLVLALIFMVTCSLLVIGLLSWSGNNLSSVAAFVQSRTTNYAATSAMETAIQNVRYSTTACPSTGLNIPVPNPSAAYDLTMTIFCSPTTETELPSAASRVINFTECVSTAVSNNACTTPYLKVTVDYDDYVAGMIANGTLCTSTCGENVTVISWVYEQTSI